MSASHKPRNLFVKNKNRSPFDDIFDFGDEKNPLPPTSVNRLKNLIKQLDEMNRRIDQLAQKL